MGGDIRRGEYLCMADEQGTGAYADEEWEGASERVQAIREEAMANPVAAAGVKRVVRPPGGEVDWAGAQSPYAIAAFTEIKTVWHPKGL